MQNIFYGICKAVLCAAICHIPLRSLAAVINVHVSGNSGTCYGSIAFNGEIVEGDAARLENEILKLHKKFHTNIYPRSCYNAVLWLHLNSPGGSVSEAISLGRVARKFELHSFANQCASSCVLVLAGGVRRTVMGSVAVHQPFFQKMNPELTAKQIGGVRKELVGRIADYIEEMNVSARLLDFMLSTPPEKSRVLTTKELQDLRLVGDDPDYDEQQTAEAAYMYGIDSGQYRRRKTLADRRCKSVQTEYECRTAVILEIPLEQASRVEDRIYEQCLRDKNLPPKEFVACLRREYIRR